MMTPDRWFKFEDLAWPPGSDPYLYRWTLAVLGRGRRCYLHRYLGSDWALDLHDHPKVFWSVGLWGGYVEKTPSGNPAMARAVDPSLPSGAPPPLARVATPRGRGAN